MEGAGRRVRSKNLSEKLNVYKTRSRGNAFLFVQNFCYACDMMDTKKQVVVIHGGDTFDTYEDYLEFLKSRVLDFEELRTGQKRWKDNLGTDLGADYEVIAPKMPNWFNAKYLEWKIWFAKIVPHLNEEVILVGHSMGGIFLAKYLSETELTKKIKALFLVGAPFDSVDTDSVADFTLGDLTKINSQSSIVFIYHSTDDDVVPYSEAAKYASAIKNSELKTFTDRGHFRQEHLFELVKDIRSLN